MQLTQKAKKITQYINGSKNITDLGIFWHRPPSVIGSELANRAGLQPLRCLLHNIGHRPSIDQINTEMSEQAKELIREGFIVIDNFLPDEAFEQVKAEFLYAINPANPESKISVTNGVRSTAGRFAINTCPATAQYLVRNRKMWALVSAAVGRKLKYEPGTYYHTETLAEAKARDTDHNIVLHNDVHYPTFKAFFLLNRNDHSNGSFVCVPRSHKLSLKRLQHEYLYSIDAARHKRGKSIRFPVYENGRMEIFGPVYSRDELKEVQISGGPNSLVIANTMGFHRRGGSAFGKDRQQVRMSFRCVETLHHALFPRFGTKSSQRFSENNYY